MCLFFRDKKRETSCGKISTSSNSHNSIYLLLGRVAILIEIAKQSCFFVKLVDLLRSYQSLNLKLLHKHRLVMKNPLAFITCLFLPVLQINSILLMLNLPSTAGCIKRRWFLEQSAIASPHYTISESHQCSLHISFRQPYK